MRTFFTLILVFYSFHVHADEISAKARYEAGAALYEATRYEAALREFEAAQAMDPRSALVYDIARCLDRLGRQVEAAAAYERFIAEAPDATSAASARARLDAIRVVEAPPPVAIASSPTPPRRPRYLGPGTLLGASLALGAAGAGLTGSALVEYNRLAASCSPDCDSATWANLPARERAGEALLGIAAAGLVGSAVWFVIVSRRK